MDETLTCADQHVIGLHLSMVFMQARRLRTRAERVELMSGKVYSGPHGGRVLFSHENAEYAADLIEAEEGAEVSNG